MLDCLSIVDKQLALYGYWKGIGGTVMLLGMRIEPLIACPARR